MNNSYELSVVELLLRDFHLSLLLANVNLSMYLGYIIKMDSFCLRQLQQYYYGSFVRNMCSTRQAELAINFVQVFDYLGMLHSHIRLVLGNEYLEEKETI